MKKISLALIASFITAPLCATSAPSPITAAPVAAKKIPLVAVPVVEVSVDAPVAVPALPSSSLFGGIRVTIAEEYDVNFAESYTAVMYRGRIVGMPVPSRMGKISFDIGYTKVFGNNMILGASVFGAYVPELRGGPGSKLVLLNNSGTAQNSVVLAAGEPARILGRKFLDGFRVNAGMLVMPSVAVKLIGELSVGGYFFDIPIMKGTSKNSLFSGAIGGGVDFAVTDRIVFGIGAKYNLVPKTFDATLDRAPTCRVYNFGKSMSIFAEIGFRVTQD